MKFRRSKMWQRLLTIGLSVLFLLVFAYSGFAQDDATDEGTAVTEEVALTANEVQANLDATWVLLAGFLVFFMQAGFAMLEGGFIGARGAVNSMAENFMDTTMTGLVFFIVGYGIAYADSSISGIFSMPVLALGGIDGTGIGDGAELISFFFQFAFAGAAATIATGAMAERTSYVGKLIYSVVVALIVYPLVVFWTWGGGWLAQAGFLDFAGSTIVHMTGGIVALVGAIFVGPRVGRVFGSPPAPSNLMLATLGTFILWFGWYGFNVGSTLVASDMNAMGLVAVNTTLAACAGTMAALFVMYFRTGKWDLSFILNGSLAGLVAITAGCAFVSPLASLVIGAIGGVVMILSINIVESLKIDDAVGAFSVHGACGIWGTLAIGLFALPGLTGGAGGLLTGGGVELLITQVIGVVAVAIWVIVTSSVIFGAIKAVGLLRMPAAADVVGIDVHEHGATVMPDLLPLPGASIVAGTDTRSSAPAVGD